MNNIEILEEFIEQYNTSYPEEKECVAIYPEQIEALENLIQENKELKEKDIHITKETVEFVNSHYIHKSKIKEIIYPSPENPIPFEVQTSEVYKKLEKLVGGE